MAPFHHFRLRLKLLLEMRTAFWHILNISWDTMVMAGVCSEYTVGLGRRCITQPLNVKQVGSQQRKGKNIAWRRYGTIGCALPVALPVWAVDSATLLSVEVYTLVVPRNVSVASICTLLSAKVYTLVLPTDVSVASKLQQAQTPTAPSAVPYWKWGIFWAAQKAAQSPKLRAAEKYLSELMQEQSWL